MDSQSPPPSPSKSISNLLSSLHDLVGQPKPPSMGRKRQRTENALDETPRLGIGSDQVWLIDIMAKEARRLKSERLKKAQPLVENETLRTAIEEMERKLRPQGVSKRRRPLVAGLKGDLSCLTEIGGVEEERDVMGNVCNLFLQVVKVYEEVDNKP